MKKLLLLIFGVMVAMPAMTQVGPVINVSQPDEKWFLAKYNTVAFYAKGNSILHIESTDTVTYNYQITKQPRFKKDTVWTSQTIENNNAAIVKVNTLEGIKTGVSSGNFTYVKTTGTLTSIKYSFTGAEVSVYSERFLGHGIINILVDGVDKGTFNQGTAEIINGANVYRTDFVRGFPTFKIRLPRGAHTIEITSTGQFLFDFFQVRDYTVN